MSCGGLARTCNLALELCRAETRQMGMGAGVTVDFPAGANERHDGSLVQSPTALAVMAEREVEGSRPAVGGKDRKRLREVARETVVEGDNNRPRGNGPPCQ